MEICEEVKKNSLSRLIFRSRAVAPLGGPGVAQVISEILLRSRVNNQRYDITGVLLFDDRIFIQVLEGPLRKVEQLYEVIARDSRHEALEVIDLLPAEAREYEGAALAFFHAAELQFPELQQVMSSAAQGVANTLCSTISQALSRVAPITDVSASCLGREDPRRHR